MLCPMALHKFTKAKTFHVHYCGCTAATALLDESSIRYAINFIRQMKPKREFVPTALSVSKEGVDIVYDNDQQFTTRVPSSMIACSNIGKNALHDTIGVVYISPLTGRHYPAFVHVYRCDSSRTAQKLLARLRTYTLVESHRLQLVELEQQLLKNNLLDINHHRTAKEPSPDTTLNSTKTNTGISSSSASSGSRQDRADPVRSITEEFQKKIDSQEPILFPPKDYDAKHVIHGNIQRSQAWKSTEPTIVGYTPDDPETDRKRRHTAVTHRSPNDISNGNEGRRSNKGKNGIDHSRRPGFSTQRSDTTADPLETVSLAFDFLKDETGSILTDHDGNVESLEAEDQDKPPVFRFRPPPTSVPPKKFFGLHNNRELSNSYHQSHASSKNDLNEYYNNTHYQSQQIPTGSRTRSETNLHHVSQSGMHLSPRYENRLINGSGIPISTNPLWTSPTPAYIGSQPNLLSTHAPIIQRSRQHVSPSAERRMASMPLQHPLYASYPNNKPTIISQQKENHHKRPGPPPPPPPPSNAYKKQPVPLQYLDSQGFILRASDGQLMNNSQYSNRIPSGVSRDYRPHSMNVHAGSTTMLDVYY